jgi:hypothetical protein
MKHMRELGCFFLSIRPLGFDALPRGWLSQGSRRLSGLT